MTTLAEVVAGDYTAAARIRWLSGGLRDVLHEVEGKLLGGSVTIERLRGRHATISLLNPDLIYTPRPTGLVAGGRIVRIDLGAMVGLSPRYVAQITGQITGDPRVEDVRDSVVTFDLISRFARADINFPKGIVYPRGMRLRDVCRANMELAGLGTSDLLFDFDDGGEALVDDYPFTTSDKILGATQALMKAAGLVGPTDNGLGQTVLFPWVDPLTIEPSIDLYDGPRSRLVSGSWQVAASAIGPNRVVVKGRDARGYPFWCEWRDLNPSSPTYNPPDGSGPAGDILVEIDSPATRTIKAGNLYARRAGYEYGLRDAVVTVRAIPDPYAANQPVVRYHDRAIDVRSWPDQVVMPVPLNAGEMSATLRMLRSQSGDFLVQQEEAA